jgi:hypothetical protein
LWLKEKAFKQKGATENSGPNYKEWTGLSKKAKKLFGEL